MPVYDDYFLSYKDRSQEGVGVSLEKILSTDNFQFILIDGQIVGTWRRAIKGSAATISVRALTRLTLDERQAIRKAAQNYGGFLGLTTHIKFHS